MCSRLGSSPGDCGGSWSGLSDRCRGRNSVVNVNRRSGDINREVVVWAWAGEWLTGEPGQEPMRRL